MKIRWYGTASLSIETENGSVLIDPYIQMRGGESPVKVSDFAEFDEIVCTHSHFDHICSLPKLYRARPRIIFGTDSVHRALKRSSIPKDSFRLVEPGKSFSVGGIKFTAFASKHVKYDRKTVLNIIFSFRFIRYFLNILIAAVQSIIYKERKQTVGYLVEAEGKRIYILGSLNYLPDVSYPENVDLLVLPYQGTSDLLTPALELIDLIKPEAVLLDHFDDAFPPLSHTVDTSDIMALCSDKLKIIKPSYYEEIIL